MHAPDANGLLGSLIFGGVDKGKYTGSLDKIPIQTQQMTFGSQDYAIFGYALHSNDLLIR